MHYWDLSRKSAFGTATVWWPIVICIPYLGYNITKCYSLLNSRVGSPKPFYHQCNLARGIDWEQETNKECMFQLWQNWFIGMHQERSVIGCKPLLHRILFVFGRAIRPGRQVTSVVHQKNRKTLQKRVLSVCPDETFPKYGKKLYFYKETYRQRRAEWNTWGVSRSVTVASETWLIINTFPRNICMSFTKYVEVVENSAIMNMLSAKVTV